MDTHDISPLKEILVVAAPLIKGVVDKFVIPKLEKAKKRFSADIKAHYIPTSEHFQEYFYRTYKRLSVINTLVFNNSQKLLKDVYIPLTLVLSRDQAGGKQGKKFKIDGYPSNLAGQYQKILVTDTAGMGKSTLMKRIFLDIIDRKVGIPILVELRRLSKEKKIIDEIYEQLNALNNDFDKELLFELMMYGEFTFILDGYDEISLIDREIVTEDIQNFISKASINNFFLTSRPESALKSFGDFKEFTIDPLKKKEAYELLKKYDNNSAISTLLIKKLNEVELSSVEEFLVNPLLVSLLFTAFEHKQVIPFKKHIFYRQVYDANFESHDLTKGESFMHDKYSLLDIDDFHRVLRFIGYKCLKLQKIEFTKDELLNIISEARNFCVGLKFSSSDFFKDLLASVPLFTQDGNYYRWAHKSLQEYFAAQFIYLDSKNKQETILQKIYDSPNLDKYLNILNIYYDVDYKTFRNVIIRNIVNDYSDFDKNNYNSLYLGVTNEEIVHRKEVAFLMQVYYYVNTTKASIGETVVGLNHKYRGEGQSDKGPAHIYFLSEDELGGDLMCIVYPSKKSKLLNILHIKKDSLTMREILPKSQDHKIIPTLDKIGEEGMTELSDSPENILNSASNFNVVSINVEHFYNNFIGFSRVNHSAAISLKYEIDIDLEKEKEVDFLMDGI